MKKKVKLITSNIHEYFNREPYYNHPKLKFIPNIIINGVSFLIAIALIGAVLYFIFRFLIKAFYHL